MTVFIEETTGEEIAVDLVFGGIKSPKRKAYFVLGPEGSGTHMMTDALREAGCYEKPEHGNDPLNFNYKFHKMPDLFVMRRSLPHAHQWSNIGMIEMKMRNQGRFKVFPILMIRDWNATVRSVMRRDGRRKYHRCEQNMRLAMFMAMTTFPRTLIYVTYEAFCLSEGFRKWLFNDKLELPYPEEFQIHYANEQYYKDLK